MGQEITVDDAVHLRELEHEHYQLEDQIKDLAQQIKEIKWGHPERLKLLIGQHGEKVRQLNEINAEVNRLRQ